MRLWTTAIVRISPELPEHQGHELILFRPQFLDPPPIDEQNPDPEQYRVEVTTRCFTRTSNNASDDHCDCAFGSAAKTARGRVRFSDCTPFGRLRREQAWIPMRGASGLIFPLEWASEESLTEDTLNGRTLRIRDAVGWTAPCCARRSTARMIRFV